MYDNLPFNVKDSSTINAFLISGLLKQISETVDYCKETGEQFTNKITYKYYNLNFTLTYSRKNTYNELYCKGSFHYLMNKGLHNANKVDFNTARGFLLEFAEIFNIDLYKLGLKPPEFGLNVSLPYDVIEVVQHTICEERKEFSYKPEYIKTSKISGAPSHDNRLKFYSKTDDCPNYAENNLLRAELQFKKIRWLHKKEIFSLGDLLDINNWHKIRDKHIEDFNKIVIYDYTIKPPKDLKIRNKLNKLSRDKFWRKLIQDCKEKKCYETKYNDSVNDLNKLSKKYGSNLKEEIMVIICKQWDWFFENKEKPKYAPLLKPKYAPFIECINTVESAKHV